MTLKVFSNLYNSVSQWTLTQGGTAISHKCEETSDRKAMIRG